MPSVENDAQSSSGATLPFPKHGVRLDYFQEMIYTVCGGMDNISTLTTTEICNQFVMPYTAATQSSLCDLLVSQGHSAVSTATVFISHAWKYKFVDVVNALENHFCNTPDVVVWFDLFSNNQHVGPTLTFDWWCGTFKTAIHDLQHVVMVLAPWEDPIPLTRAWCLFELYCAAETNCTFEIAMSSKEVQSFLAKTISDAENVLNDMMGVIKAERSEAFKPEDRNMIFEVVEQTVGFSTVNSMVFDEIRKWVLGTIKKHVYELYVDAWKACDSTSQNPCPIMTEVIDNPDISIINENVYDGMLALAVIYRLQSQLAQSEKFYRLCYEWYRKHYGERHRHTLIRLNNIAYVVLCRGDVSAAASIYEECLAQQLAEASAENEEDILTTMNSLGSCYQQLSRLSEAEQLFRNLLQRQLQFFGTKENQYVMATINNLASTLDILGQYAESEAEFKELLELTTRIRGADHPDTLRVMSNLGTLYANPHVNRLEEAESILRKCMERRKIVLGLDHVNTLHVMGNLSVVLQGLQKYNEANDLLADVYHGRTRLLGETHHMTLQSMHNLAMQNRDLAFAAAQNEDDSQSDYFRVAETLFTSCARLQEQTLGVDHLDTLTTQYNLATMYDRKGLLDLALPLFRTVLAQREKVLGIHHPDTHNAQHQVAFALQRLNQVEECIEVHRDLLSRRFAKFGPAYTGTWSTVYFLALAIDSQYPVLPKEFNDEEFRPTDAYKSMKDQCQRVENELFALFRSQLLDSIPFEVPIDEEAHITQLKKDLRENIFDGYVDLFSRYARAFCHRIALILMRVLVETKLRMHGNDETHEEVVSYQYALAKLLVREKADSTEEVIEDDQQRLEDNREGESLLNFIWKHRQQALGDDHEWTLQVLSDYALCFYHKGEYVAAEPLLRNAVLRFKEVFGVNDSETINLAKFWCITLHRLGKYNDEDISLLYPMLWYLDENEEWKFSCEKID
jgi:tetratricopeptide (TPR) repeat protein